MSTKYLFVKRSNPLKRRLLLWGGPLLLLTPFLPMLLASLQSPNTAADQSAWAAPVEPPGTIVVTTKTAPAKPAISSVAQAPTPAMVTPTPLPTPVAQGLPTQNSTVNEDAALREALNQWQQAWSNKNVASYLALYGPDFVPPTGVNRQVWEGTRYERIASKQKINIAIQNLQWQINSNTATAKFTQIYSDERLRMTDRKTLVWQKHNGRWLIQRETTD